MLRQKWISKPYGNSWLLFVAFWRLFVCCGFEIELAVQSKHDLKRSHTSSATHLKFGMPETISILIVSFSFIL